MNFVILSLLFGTGLMANAVEIPSVGPDQLNCNTLSLIESYKHVSIIEGAGVKRLAIQDMWIQSKQGLPKLYTITSYLPNQSGDSVLEATEVTPAIGTEINGVEIVLEKKSNFKSGAMTYVKQTPKGSVRGSTTYSFSCE